MDILDSRSLRYLDCYAQKFSKPGKAYYRLSTVAGSCLPIDKESAISFNINDHDKERKNGHQINVQVHLDGHRLVAEQQNLEIEAGDTILWNTPDPRLQGFTVQGECPEGRFDSSSMSFNAVYTHAFGSPGEYTWVDFNGNGLSGTIIVNSLDMNGVDQCKKWIDSLSQGVLILIQDNRVDKSKLEIVTGQTVFWAIERAPGISITDSRMVGKEMEGRRQ